MWNVPILADTPDRTMDLPDPTGPAAVIRRRAAIVAP
jgi:hypothetical protein